jgi:hypothetical protein
MEAVKELGKDWVRVAVLVLSRTNKQCSQRWLTFWDPTTADQTGMGNKGPWTLEEDAKLGDAVKEVGTNYCDGSGSNGYAVSL